MKRNLYNDNAEDYCVLFFSNRNTNLPNMEYKKKTFLDNLRQFAKLGNPKKPRKKKVKKPGRTLAHRRSISVPNLTLVPGGTIAPGAIDRRFCPGVSDSDSISSCSNTDAGPNPDTDRPSDSLLETGLRVPACRTDGAGNRMSPPAGALVHVQDLRDGPMDSEDKVNPAQHKQGKEEVARFTFDPIPAPQSAFLSTPAFSPRPELEERGRLCSEDIPANTVLAESISAALVRANFQAEQASAPKRSSPCEPKQLCDKGTPPVMKKALADRSWLALDRLGTPLESADGTSLDSACGTPSEEQVNLSWMMDSEDLDGDLCSPLFMKDLSTEEGLLEQLQAEDAAEDAEVSLANTDFTKANTDNIWAAVTARADCLLWKIGSRGGNGNKNV